MPLVLKDPRGTSPYYSVRGTHLGVKLNRTTKSADRATAKKMLKQFEKEIECRLFSPPVKKGPTFGEAATRYFRENDLSGGYLQRLVTRLHDTTLDQFNQQMIDDLAFELYPTQTNATRNRQVYTPVSAILNHAGVDLHLRRPKKANGEKREFTFRLEEVEALIAAALSQEPEFGIYLTFLLYTGCRMSEGLMIDIRDIHLDRGTALARDTKNGTSRLVHLPPVVVAALANHPRGLNREGRLFKFHKGQRLNARLDKAAAAAGVEIPDGVAFHAFRHTWGHWMRIYGGLDTTGLVATGAWLSHDAARRYEHAVASKEARQANSLPVIGAFRVRPVGGNGGNTIKIVR